MSQGPGPAGPPQNHGDDHWQQGPQAPYTSPGQGPGWGQTPPPSGPPAPKKRPWLLVAGALGCVALLVLVVAGGIGFLAWRSWTPDPTAGPETTSSASTDPSGSAPAPSPAEPTTFEPISPIDENTRTAEENREVLATSPMTAGGIPAIGTCELPAITADPTQEALQAFLDAGTGCISGAWASLLGEKNLSWSTPKVVVYTWPDVPDSSCAPNTFQQYEPRMCNLDTTLYWPLEAGNLATHAAPEDVPSAYLVDLAHSLMNPLTWQTSIAVYYQNYLDDFEESDPQWRDGYRRFNLQMRCLSSATTMQLPAELRPSEALQAIMLDEGTWTVGDDPRSIPTSSMVTWVRTGLDSGGDVSDCNTWNAPSYDIDG